MPQVFLAQMSKRPLVEEQGAEAAPFRSQFDFSFPNVVIFPTSQAQDGRELDIPLTLVVWALVRLDEQEKQPIIFS